MTEIVLAHDQKHVPGHYFSVGPNALPKRSPDLLIIDTKSSTTRTNTILDSHLYIACLP